ncbi:hypothetical protein SCP_0207960 [Sparassis crispa]|uniref:Cns1/TTC4 wheel domain-containing protein n=1 Tax=Sparassis crispa TaxID=139825 RepID=A0A401GBM9_9APHY|nr:hypothetical protein SCP_0207960 [Sparassis crispa]GBE79596.1 hypothetical protein SCP_0207960 [Sparassis crispa]
MASNNPLPLPQHVQDDDKLASFDSIPLFMKSLPEDAADDPVIGALQSLAFEGTPDEVAQNFKEQGNDYFKGKRYREALQFYTQGVDAAPSNKTLMEALLCNRAACNLELKNYGLVLKDCSEAITLNPQSSKAHYRSSVALLALERFEEALDCCYRCLRFDQNNESVQAVREKTAQQKALQEKKEKEKQERIRRKGVEKRRLRTAFKERNFVTISQPETDSESPYLPRFDPEDPTQSTLIMPVFFLYPQYATSDVVSHFVEDTPFSAHLAVMFPPQAPPPEWDTKHEYVDGQLVIYAMTHRKRLLKRDLKISKLGFPGAPHVHAPAHRIATPRDFTTSKIDDGGRLGPITIKMSVQHKILRTANAPTTAPDETEISVAQALIDLENGVPELKTELRPLQISAAREVDVRGGKKAIVIFVPVPQLKAFHKVQQRLTRELEKKFSDRHVVFVAQRRMLRKPTRTSRVKQKRPRSRTLTNVHEKILEDLVFPTEIVGKRTRVAVDGSKLLKVFLDSKDATSLEYKLDSFSSVYRRLTGKDVVFEFPVQAQE